jgi:hypothetical protein
MDTQQYNLTCNIKQHTRIHIKHKLYIHTKQYSNCSSEQIKIKEIKKNMIVQIKKDKNVVGFIYPARYTIWDIGEISERYAFYDAEDTHIASFIGYLSGCEHLFMEI